MRKPISTVILLFSALLATCSLLLPASAQKASVPKPQNNLALAEPAVREMLPLMHADSRGRVSKQDFMHFMEAEFDRLDADKTGQLDVAALTRNTQARTFVGK